ncbi:hypothetical protein Tco_0173204 [Tanacetum coccineum]
MSTIRVKYEWTPPRCSSCKVGLKLGSKVQFKLTKQVYLPVFKKNGASSSGTKKQVGFTRQEASTYNPFDALNTVENDDELGEQLEKSDDGIEELNDDIARCMSFFNRAGGGENDADLLDYEDFDCYDV